MQVYPNELYHYGVLGMKWGVRRYQNADGTLTNAGKRKYGSGESLKAKAEYKAAKKQYNKDFNAAYNKSYQSYSLNKNKRAASDERWQKAYDSAKAANAAQSKYKIAKAKDKAIAKEERQKLKDKALEVRKSNKGLKYAYNYKTSELAAKKILDENMSYNDAVKSAKKTAWRNTAIILGTYGAYTLGAIAIAKKTGYL